MGGKSTGPNPTDRGKRGVKRSVLTEGNGIPIGLAIDGANRNDFKMARETIESIVIERPEPTEDEPQGMCLDKGYDYEEIRLLITEFGFTAHIRARGEEAQAIKDEAGYKARRWVVERTHSWMNRFRRLLVSAFAGSLGEETTELHRHAPYCLRLHHIQTGRLTEIN